MLSVVFIDNPATSALKEKEAPYRTPSVAEAQFHSSVCHRRHFLVWATHWTSWIISPRISTKMVFAAGSRP